MLPLSGAASSARDVGPGSGPMPEGIARSKDICEARLGESVSSYGAAGMSDTNHAFIANGLIVRP